MKELFQQTLKEANSLAQVRDSLVGLIVQVKKEKPDTEIWFITGVITAEGPEHRTRNRELLREYGEHIREKYGWWAFSAVDVFTDEILGRMRAGGAQSQDYAPMWCGFLRQAGTNITGIITTPRWEIAPGCRAEVETVKSLGGKVFNLAFPA